MSDGPLAGNSVTTAEVPAASLMPAADSPEPHEPEEIPQEPSPEALADEHSVTPASVVSPADFLPHTCDDAPPKPTSTKTNAVVRGVETRLTFPRMHKLLKQVSTLKRKCQRLLKKRDELQSELSALRQQAKETQAVMKKSNLAVLQVCMVFTT